MFFMAEYANMITVSSLATILFFGGWLSPFPESWTWQNYLPGVGLVLLGVYLFFDTIVNMHGIARLQLAVVTMLCLGGGAACLIPPVAAAIQGPFWFTTKVLLFLFFYVWMRGTLPRFRYDQLMAFGWKLLLPVSLANLVITAFVIILPLLMGAPMIQSPLILFFVLAVMAVAGAVLLILAREPIHSALALVLVMVSLAVLYLLLGAEFIAAVQIIVYAGAVMVLFVFVIMLLNAGTEDRTQISKIATWVGIPLGFFLMLEIAHIFWHARMTASMASGAGVPYEAASTHDLSMALFQQYLFPFEATSILILIALLGALVLAKKDE